MPMDLSRGEDGGKKPWFCHGIECPPYSVVLSNTSATPGSPPKPRTLDPNLNPQP